MGNTPATKHAINLDPELKDRIVRYVESLGHTLAEWGSVTMTYKGIGVSLRTIGDTRWVTVIWDKDNNLTLL